MVIRRAGGGAQSVALIFAIGATAGWGHLPLSPVRRPPEAGEPALAGQVIPLTYACIRSRVTRWGRSQLTKLTRVSSIALGPLPRFCQAGSVILLGSDCCVVEGPLGSAQARQQRWFSRIRSAKAGTRDWSRGSQRPRSRRVSLRPRVARRSGRRPTRVFLGPRSRTWRRPIVPVKILTCSVHPRSRDATGHEPRCVRNDDRGARLRGARVRSRA
jgi:hypothetical protein